MNIQTVLTFPLNVMVDDGCNVVPLRISAKNCARPSIPVE